jgi:hypothetical protein
MPSHIILFPYLSHNSPTGLFSLEFVVLLTIDIVPRNVCSPKQGAKLAVALMAEEDGMEVVAAAIPARLPLQKRIFFAPKMNFPCSL